MVAAPMPGIEQAIALSALGHMATSGDDVLQAEPEQAAVQTVSVACSLPFPSPVPCVHTDAPTSRAEREPATRRGTEEQGDRHTDPPRMLAGVRALG